MTVTIQQVAQVAGLSRQTVSAVLNDKAHLYKPGTCEKVRQVAAQLGYRPNSSARAMRSGRFNCITLLLSTSTSTSQVFTPVLVGVFDTLDTHGIRLNIARVPDEQLRNPDALPEILKEFHSDGLLINYYAGFPAEMESLLHRLKVPAIWMNSKHASDCVRPNDFDAGRQAARSMIELGHTNIAYVHYGRISHYSMVDRIEGYRAAMRDAGLDARVIDTVGDVFIRNRVSHARQMLAAPDRPTAIIAYDEAMVAAVLHAADVVGLRVPRDLSISAFCDHKISGNGAYVDTWETPLRQVAAEAAQALIHRLDHTDEPFEARLIPFGFIHGESTAAPPVA